MPFDVAAVLKQIDDVLSVPYPTTNAEIAQKTTQVLACIERFSLPGSTYRSHVEESRKIYGFSHPYDLHFLVGILTALRQDIEAGRLVSFTELIHADLFSDFLEGAEYLLSEGWKDAAAVIVGSVLEEHLRKLAAKSGIPTTLNNKPKKADQLNSDLAGANIYSKIDQKNVTAWLAIRNAAAHGEYKKYDHAQVDLQLRGVRDFLGRYPA